MIDDRLVTIKEVVERASISRYTLYRDIKAGKIPVIYFGRTVRIKEKDAEAYAKEVSGRSGVLRYRKEEA